MRCSWVMMPLSPHGRAAAWCGLPTPAGDHFCTAHGAILATAAAIKHLALLETAEAPV